MIMSQKSSSLRDENEKYGLVRIQGYRMKFKSLLCIIVVTLSLSCSNKDGYKNLTMHTYEDAVFSSEENRVIALQKRSKSRVFDGGGAQVYAETWALLILDTLWNIVDSVSLGDYELGSEWSPNYTFVSKNDSTVLIASQGSWIDQEIKKYNYLDGSLSEIYNRAMNSYVDSKVVQESDDYSILYFSNKYDLYTLKGSSHVVTNVLHLEGDNLNLPFCTYGTYPNWFFYEQKKMELKLVDVKNSTLIKTIELNKSNAYVVEYYRNIFRLIQCTADTVYALGTMGPIYEISFETMNYNNIVKVYHTDDFSITYDINFKRKKYLSTLNSRQNLQIKDL